MHLVCSAMSGLTWRPWTGETEAREGLRCLMKMETAKQLSAAGAGRSLQGPGGEEEEEVSVSVTHRALSRCTMHHCCQHAHHRSS